jgi:hypothetical protein
MLPVLTINGSVATIGGKWLGGEAINPFNPYNLPPRTIRFEMPTGWTWSDPASSWPYYTWTQVSSSPNVWDVYVGVEDVFVGTAIRDVTSIIILGANLSSGLEVHSQIPGTVSIRSLYCGTGWSEAQEAPIANCSGITDCCNVDFGDATSLYECFAGSKNTLTIADNFKMEHATDLRSFMYDCHVLTRLPTIVGNTQVTNCYTAFLNCLSVSSGILDMYNKLSGQQTPPSETFWAFHECGSNTATGSAELAQIPSAWK